MIAAAEGRCAFRKIDPQIAIMFVMGSIVHFAMVRYVFRIRKPHVAEDVAVREMIDMTLAGLTEPRVVRLTREGQESQRENRTRMRRGIIGQIGMIGALAVSALLAGCGGSQSNPVEANTASPASERTPVVATVRAQTRPVAAAVQVTGSFVAKEASDVAPQAAGRVIETAGGRRRFRQTGAVDRAVGRSGSAVASRPGAGHPGAG